MKRIKSFLAPALTACLLCLLLRKVGLAELVETLLKADLVMLLLSLCVITPLLVLVSAVRWQVLVRSQGVVVSLPRLCALSLVGKLFNNLLPTNVGGDLVRGYELGRLTRRGSEAMASVFMDRFTGFVVLVLFATVSSLTNLRLTIDSGLLPLLAVAVAALTIVLWLILDIRPLNVISRWAAIPLAQRPVNKLKDFHMSVSSYRTRPLAISLALGWSVVFMVLAIANVYVSALVFDPSISLWRVSIIVPIILVIAMLPITVNGLGLLEWAYVLLFTAIGLPASVGLATVVLIRGKELLMALSGAVLYPIVSSTKATESTSSALED